MRVRRVDPLHTHELNDTHPHSTFCGTSGLSPATEQNRSSNVHHSARSREMIAIHPDEIHATG